MKELKKSIIAFQEQNKLTKDDVSKKLNISIEVLEKILNAEVDLDEKEVERILNIINTSNASSSFGRKAVRSLDLIFRFTATILSLVVVILSIYGYNNTKTLIALLAVSVGALAIIKLPRIEK